MRFYKNFYEVNSEVMRDLAEMGTLVKPKTMQNKSIEGNPDFYTKELQNYCYTILNPLDVINNPHEKVHKLWADAEFAERTCGKPINPGNAWQLRSEVWTQFLDENGYFDYTYANRMWATLEEVIETLSKDHDTRRAFLPIFVDTDCFCADKEMRIPCTLGYQFQIRDGKLNMTYMMRSCDIMTHFANDVYLACKLMKYVADAVGVEVGHFTHFICSLHAYQKDLGGIF